MITTLEKKINLRKIKLNISSLPFKNNKIILILYTFPRKYGYVAANLEKELNNSLRFFRINNKQYINTKPIHYMLFFSESIDIVPKEDKVKN